MTNVPKKKDNPGIPERVATLEEAMRNINSKLGELVDIRREIEESKKIWMDLKLRFIKMETQLKTWPRAITVLLTIITLILSVSKLMEVIGGIP